MNKNYTNKLISNIQSFADRLRNDDRSSLMFEADWDTLMESKTMLRQQQAEIEALKGKAEQSYDEGFKRGVQQTALNGQARGC